MTEIDGWNHIEEKWGYFEARIEAMAGEEAKHSPKLRQIVDSQVSHLEATDDG